jgi:hypothetical protein
MSFWQTMRKGFLTHSSSCHRHKGWCRFYSGRTAYVMQFSGQRKELRTMAVIIDRMELSHNQRLELYEEGVTWIVQEPAPGSKPAQEIKLDAAAASRLFDFLLLYEEQLVRWSDGFTP